MKDKKDVWKFVLQTAISILSAIATALGVTSCMAWKIEKLKNWKIEECRTDDTDDTDFDSLCESGLAPQSIIRMVFEEKNLWNLHSMLNS